MEDYAKGLHKEEKKDVKQFEQFLDLYSTRRDAQAERNQAAVAEVETCEKELAKLQRRFERRKARYLQDQRAASLAVRLRNEKRARAREQKKSERVRERREKSYFWASSVGRVIVSLDGQNAVFTPGSSRRSSVVERVEKAGDDVQETSSIDVVLRLSYIVPKASWSSRYELRINSPSSSARLTYRAEFINSSTETWRDTRVTLSTSQAAFSGIGARIPSLDAWNIKLLENASSGSSSNGPSWDRILDVPRPVPVGNFALLHHQDAARKPSHYSKLPPSIPSAQSGSPFGVPIKASMGSEPQAGGLFGGQSQAGGLSGQPKGGGLFGAAPQQPQNLNGFGSNSNTVPSNTNNVPSAPPPPPPPPSAPAKSLFGQSMSAPNNAGGQSPQNNPFDTAASAAVELEADDSDTQSLTSSALEHQDSVKQDYGMTTSYELPSRRTLAPSLVSRRHVLADLDLKSVTLTYVVVPKRQEAAFLRARVKNTSSLTLHPGQVGITVDGTFVGTASLEMCGPNVFFNISLGIDPGIQVKYAKPAVKLITGAMFFNKEDGAKFRRSCWVKNTKTTAVDLIVFDQVPVSDDEKLRVNLLQPAGLEKEGDEADIEMEKKKGHGTATLQKNGQIKWTLRLEPREEIRLVLEYEAKVPTGSDVSAA